MFENPEAVFGGSQRMLALIESIYATVQDPSLWPTVLEQIGQAVDGQQNLLFFDGSPGPAVPPMLACSNTNPDFTNLFVTYYASVNVLAEPCDQMFPMGTARYSHLAVPDADFEQSEFLNDFFKPYGMHYSMGIKIPFGQDSIAYLSIQRPKSLLGFNSREGVVLETLKPHLERAFSLHKQLAAAGSIVLGLESSLDALEQAVFGLDAAGKVIFSNSRAEDIAQQADGVCLSKGRLSCVFSDQGRSLSAAISAATMTEGLASGSSMLVHRKSGKDPLRLTVTPFTSRLPGRAVHVAALVFVSDPESLPQSRATILRALYGLTPVETRVADLLLEGLQIRDVAERLGTTLETARFHTKRVLAKTGTRRQTELLRLMLSLPRV